jgi:hypothetical protein
VTTTKAVVFTERNIRYLCNQMSGLKGDDLRHQLQFPETETYYFVKNYPRNNLPQPLSWVLLPDFMFHEELEFVKPESTSRFTEVTLKSDEEVPWNPKPVRGGRPLEVLNHER